MSSSVDAFNIGAGAKAADLSSLIPGIIFAVILTIFAYILLKMFEEVKEGKLKLERFLIFVVRLFLLFAVLSYFLLR